MAEISTQQLAELLSGIARAQAAVIQGIESAMPGARSSHVIPALQNAAHLLDHPDPTLTDLPVRILMSYMGRIGPDIANVERDLERLLSGAAAPRADAPPPAVELPAPTESAGDDLDFSKTE